LTTEMSTTAAVDPVSRPAVQPEAALRALHLFGLCGLAFVAPVLDLLGRNATFFVAHDTGRVNIVLFALTLVLLPPAVLFAVVSGISFASRAAGRLAMAATVGVLVAITIVPPIDRRASLSTLMFALAGAAIAVGAGTAYARLAAVRTFATYLSPAPVLFCVLFLFTSPVSALVTGADPQAVSNVGGQDAPVMVVMLDELPLGVLLTPEGKIDAERFPGFARLASLSTWYPNATTLAPWTNWAVPSIMTGLRPSSKTPIATEFPHSLFTLLGGQGAVHSFEAGTRVCPRSVCPENDGSDGEAASLVKDSAIVALHQLLPNDLADSWLPRIDGQWADFGDDGGDGEANASDWKDAVASDNHTLQGPRFERFLNTVNGKGSSELWWFHELLPHMPYRYLPDGRLYSTNDALPEGMTDWVTMGKDPSGTPSLQQRLVLQTQYVDSQINRLLDKLTSTGLLQRSMLVVVSDHGISFEPGGNRRAAFGLDDTNRSEVLPVPLFIKYPDQRTGVVDERRAQIVDVLPTIADALEIELPSGWRFDGVSLHGRPTPARNTWIDNTGSRIEVDDRISALPVAEQKQELFGAAGGPHDLYRVGPHGDLVGRSVTGQTGSPRASASIRIADAEQYADVDPSSRFVPALVRARVTGVQPGTWLAIAVNGTIAGVSPVFAGRGERTVIEAMIDPSLLAAGSNAITAYEVEPSGATLRPITGR
jgi:hypothetical protein